MWALRRGKGGCVRREAVRCIACAAVAPLEAGLSWVCQADSEKQILTSNNKQILTSNKLPLDTFF